MTKKQAFPPVSLVFLEALEAKFPDTLPGDTTAPLDHFRVLQGNQAVIRFLRHQYEMQTDNILKG